MASEQPQRFYVTLEGKVVEEGDLDAAQLVYVEGQEFDEARLSEFGPNVAKEVKAKLSKTEAKAVESAPEDKAIEGPSENKAARSR